MPLGRTVAAIALAGAVVAGGLALPLDDGGTGPADATTPTPDRLQQAVSTWNWTGFSGQTTIPLDDQGWVDVAFPVMANRTHIRFDLEWCAGEEVTSDGSDGRFWLMEGLPGRLLTHDHDDAGGDDGEMGVSVSAGPVHREVRRTDPNPTHVPGRDAGRCSHGYSEYWYRGSLSYATYPRLVHHYTVAWDGRRLADGDGTPGTLPNGTPQLTVTWWNTTVTTRQGAGFADTWQYTLEDFSSQAELHIDGPGQGPRAADASRLDIDLTRGGPTSMFRWHLPEVAQVDDSSIERPNGSVVYPASSSGPYSLHFETTTQTGNWTFRVPERAGLDGSQPVLRGVSFTPAGWDWPDTLEPPGWS